MPDPADAATAGGKKGLDFLKQKVGPLPLGVWLVIAVGLLYYFRTQQSKSATGGQQTDPAGNQGTIDPATGYVYGSPEDKAALSAAQQGGGDSGTGTAGQNATTGGQTYADNNSWGIAAVNYLVGLGIDATTANQAVQLYLSSQALTMAQQGDVNLAIQALGPPPTLPGPTITNPPPVTTPPGGKPPPVTTPPPGKKPTASNPVTGLATVAKSGHSWQVKWNRAKNATSYHVLCTDMATKKITSEHDVTTTTATFQGLTPQHSYVCDVWAEPEAGAKGSGAHAHVSITLPKK